MADINVNELAYFINEASPLFFSLLGIWFGLFVLGQINKAFAGDVFNQPQTNSFDVIQKEPTVDDLEYLRNEGKLDELDYIDALKEMEKKG